MRKVLIFSTILFAVLIVAAGGYWLFNEFKETDKEIDNLKSEITNQESEIKSLSESKSALEKVIDKLNADIKIYQDKEKASEEEKKSPYFGWKTYTDNDLKIKFMYPPAYNIVDVENGLVVNATMSDKLGNDPYQLKVLNLINLTSANPYPSAKAMGIIKPPKTMPQGFTLNGKYIPFDYTGMGEGYFIYSGGFSRLLAKVKTGLYVDMNWSFSSTTKLNCDTLTYPSEENITNKTECEYFNEGVVETNFSPAKADIDNAILILQSIKYL